MLEFKDTEIRNGPVNGLVKFSPQEGMLSRQHVVGSGDEKILVSCYTSSEGRGILQVAA